MKRVLLLFVALVLLISVNLFSQNAAVRFADLTSSPLTQTYLNQECQAQFGQDYTMIFPAAADRWRFQWYKDGGDNIISPLDAFGHPTGDDIEATGIISPGNTTGQVSLGPTQAWIPSAATFADAGGAGNTFKGDKIYIRIFNASTIAAATKSICFTSLYTITSSLVQVTQPYIPAYAWTPWDGTPPPSYTAAITSTPDNVDIFVNGLDSGFNTPHTFPIYTGSNVTFTVAKTGYSWTPASLVITDAHENTSQHFTGTLITYTVDITSNPDDADILANGIDTGFNTPHTFTLVQGSSVTYTVEKSGYSWTPSSLVINNIQANTSQNFTGSLETVYTVALTSTPDNADIYANEVDTGFNTPHTFSLIEGSSITYRVAKTGYNWTPSTFVVNNIEANTSQNFTGSQIIPSVNVAVNYKDGTTQTKSIVNQEFGYSTSYPNGYPYPTPSTGFDKWYIQFYTSIDDVIDPLDAFGNPTGDDVEAVTFSNAKMNLLFSPIGSLAMSGCIFAATGSQYNAWIGSKIYIRIFNSNTKVNATKTMSTTSLYTVTSAQIQTVNIFPTYGWTSWTAFSPLATCAVNITSTPTDADIYANLVDTGFNTPYTFRLAPGSNGTYTVAKPGYTWTPTSLVINNISANTSQSFTGTQTIVPGEPVQVIPPGNVLIASVSLETPDATSFSIDCTVINTNALPSSPPNGGLDDDNSYAIILNATSGTADITVNVPAGTWWICGYWGGSWHQATPYPYSNTVSGNVTLYGVPFGSKGDVPFVISEGEGLDPTLPVTLSSFTATIASQSYVNLTWVTESETQVLGYNVYRSEDRSIDNSIKLNQFIIPATNTSERQSYTLTDSDGLQANLTYYYWLENVDMGGGNNLFGPVSATITGQTTPDIPVVTSLGNAYPNPIRTGDAAKIDVNIKTGETGTINIYNIRGQLVKYYNVQQGEHKLFWDTKGCGSGIYFYKLSTPTANVIRKVVVTN